MDVPVPPVLHEYVEAPVTTIVADWPVHKAEGVEAVVIVGVGFTEMVLTAWFEQPLVPVPITEYVILEAGLTEIGFPVIAPGFQV
jgi:hypothetical protein